VLLTGHLVGRTGGVPVQPGIDVAKLGDVGVSASPRPIGIVEDVVVVNDAVNSYVCGRVVHQLIIGLHPQGKFLLSGQWVVNGESRTSAYVFIPRRAGVVFDGRAFNSEDQICCASAPTVSDNYGYTPSPLYGVLDQVESERRHVNEGALNQRKGIFSGLPLPVSKYRINSGCSSDDRGAHALIISALDFLGSWPWPLALTALLGSTFAALTA
jgi:hypothetical protein